MYQYILVKDADLLHKSALLAIFDCITVRVSTAIKFPLYLHHYL